MELTGTQLVTRLKAKLNSLDTASNRTVRPEMALLKLNEAYLKLSRAKYKKDSGTSDDSAFQFTQLTTDELNHLTDSQLFGVTDSLIEPGIKELNINDIPNYWVHLRSKIKIVYKGKTYWISDINYKTLDTLSPSTWDPFNKSVPLNPTIYFEQNKIKIIAENFGEYSLEGIMVTFLRFPETITLNSIHKAPYLDEIVDTAAELVLEEWGDERSMSLLGVTKTIDNK